MADEGRFIDPDTLTNKEEKIGDVVVEVATIDVGAFEARISRWPAGSQVPRHAHSTEIITVLLRGKARSWAVKQRGPEYCTTAAALNMGHGSLRSGLPFLLHFNQRAQKL